MATLLEELIEARLQLDIARAEVLRLRRLMRRMLQGLSASDPFTTKVENVLARDSNTGGTDES